MLAMERCPPKETHELNCPPTRCEGYVVGRLQGFLAERRMVSTYATTLR
jgi:hypothetical protein